jgi:hypothetical protein
VTYTNAALTGLVTTDVVAGADGSAASKCKGDKKGEIKQAATSVAARFLYMVVLYMAPR